MTKYEHMSRDELIMELEESRTRYEEFYNYTPVGYCTLDDNGIIKEINISGANLIGKDPSFLVNLPFIQFISVDDSDKFLTHLKQCRESKEQLRVELKLKRDEGQVFYIELFARALMNKEQKIGYRINFIDITPHKKIEALRKSEDKYYLLFNHMPLGCIVWRKDFRVDSWNSAAEKIFGYSENEAIGMLGSEFIIPQDLKKEHEIWKKLMAGNLVVKTVDDSLTKNGERIVCEWTNALLNDSEGNIHGVISMVQDITVKRKAEEAEKEAQLLINSIIDSIPDVFYILDTNGRFVRWNSYLRDEIVAKSDNLMPDVYAIDVIHRDDRSIIQSGMENILRNGKEESVEVRLLLRGGPDFRWFVISGRRIIIKNSPFIIGTGVDITEHKRIENLLHVGNATIKAMADSYSTTIYMSIEQKITYINPKFIKLFGYSLDEVSSLDQWFLKAYPDETYRRYVMDEQQKMIAHDMAKPPEKERLDTVVTCKDGSKKDISWGYINIGEQTWAFGIDLTERKIMENALLKARVAAEEASHSKSLFLANMSHELRTPLNAILGYAQLFKDDTELSENYKRGINIIEKSGQHLLSIINDILDIAKIEAGTVELENKSFNLKKFLHFIEEMIKVKVKQKNLIFIVEYSKDLPIYVSGDEKKLSQVLINILGNAIKFTQDGSVSFRVGKKNEKIIFMIEDTGPGIEEEKIEEIFLPFIQLGDHMKKDEGTGLGLAITRKLVEIMGGKLKVESIYGKGCKFWFEIELPETTPPSDDVQLNRDNIKGYKGEKRKILIVDDKFENRRLLSDVLNKLGFYTEEAEHGLQCLEKLEKFKPDLIFMDIIMPQMNGYEATRKIREDEVYKEIKIIAISASRLDKPIIENLKIDFDDWLLKPFIYNELLNTLSKHLCLEWIYKEEYGYFSIKEEEEKIILPPPDIIETFYQISKKSNFNLIKKELERIKDLNKDYKGFYKKIKKLADGFEIKNIRSLLETYREDKNER